MQGTKLKPATKGEVRNIHGFGGRSGSLARQHDEAAVAVLAGVFSSRVAPDAARVEAARVLIYLSRGSVVA